MIPFILLLLALLYYFLFFNKKIETFLSKKVKKVKKKSCTKSTLTNNFRKPIPKKFIASKTFQGSKSRYVFKNDHRGVGYYLDTNSI
jgi:hypothetical protein